MTVNEMAAIEIVNRLRELTPEEHIHLYECLRGRSEWANCIASDFDPMLRREKILAYQKEMVKILEPHDLQPWQYMQFTRRDKRGVIINIREIMNYYECYDGRCNDEEVI